jgi:SpoVK/Ycf46/Vps4 family AAA+-type ATPase
MGGYEAIGGMETQIEQIRELVEWPLTRPELYKHFGRFHARLFRCYFFVTDGST